MSDRHAYPRIASTHPLRHGKVLTPIGETMQIIIILSFLILGSTYIGCAPADPLQVVQNDPPMSLQFDATLSPIVDANTPNRGSVQDASPNGTVMDMSVGETDANVEPQVTDASGGGTPPEPPPNLSEIEALAAELDTLCETDCAKDAMCNPDTAEPSDDCIENYCGYVNSLDANALSQILLDCFEADRDLLLCVTTLSCDDYNQHYYGDESETVTLCASQQSAYDNACSDFFEDGADM